MENTLLSFAVKDKNYDSRLVKKNIARGEITEKDFEDHISSLPDDSANAEWMDIQELNRMDMLD